MTEMAKLSPIHPGEVLMEDFIEPLGITQHKVAVAIGVPPRRINEIVHGKRRITADTALRLARYFGTTDLFWVNLQNRYDLEIERDSIGEALDRIQPLRTDRRGSSSGSLTDDRQVAGATSSARVRSALSRKA
jgi:addiction module HigA family antidote